MYLKNEYVRARKEDPFDLTTWSTKDLTYNESHSMSKFNTLHFVYLIPAKLIELCDICFGQVSKLTEEDIDEDFLFKYQPDKLYQDHESVENHDVDPETSNPSLKFLNLMVKPNLEEKKDYIFVTKKLFKVVKELVPKTKELKRVVYRRSAAAMVQVELQFVYMPVLIVIDDYAKKKDLTRKNLPNYIHYFPFSRFLNWFSISEFLKEFTMSEYEIAESEMKNSMLRFADGGFGLDEQEKKLISTKILKGLFKAKNLKYSEISEEMFQSTNGFIFHVREGGTSYLKFGGKTPIGGTATLAIENGATSGAHSYGYSGVSNLTNRYQNSYGNSYSNNLYSNNYYDNEVTKALDEEELNEGIVGFKNIGNTCYMNSAMQCLVHVDFLKTFLIENRFESMINDDNPIGANGDMIKSLAALVKEYWNTHDNYVTPYSFKRCVSKYMPAFEGYSHHDSQEFLSQLLDTCHEDTNQILKKPYICTPTLQPGQKTDKQMARESWILHLKRNNSFFIHNFFGQFRSEIQCPICRSIYLKFDCFQVISLPIPSKREDSTEFFFVAKDQRENKALKTRFSAKSYSNFNDVTIRDLRKEVLSKDELVSENSLLRIGFMGFDEESILFYDHKTLADLFMVKEQHFMRDLFVYELVEADRAALMRRVTRVSKERLALEEPVDVGPEIPEEEVIQNCNNEEYLKTRRELIFVIFNANFDYYDKNSLIYDQIKECQPRYGSLKKSPVFAKAFYLTQKHRVIDLYFRVFEKFYFKMNEGNEEKKEKKYKYYDDTSSSSEEEADKKEKDDDLQSLPMREQFERLMKADDMFFYLRIDDVFYGEEQWFKSLKDFADRYTQPDHENTLKIEIFFREGERKKCKNEKKIGKIDLKYFRSCYYRNFIDFKVVSEQYSDKRDSKYNLKNLITKFSEPEVLDNQNMYRCGKCKKEVKAQIKMEIQKVPRVLVIFFKRIKKGYYSDSPEITYPEMLDMRPFVNDDSPIEAYDVSTEEILDENNIELYKQRAESAKQSQNIQIENVDSSDEEADSYSNKIREEKSSDSEPKDPLKQIYLPDSTIETDLNYELFGVVNHYGSQNFGHYTSIVKTERGWINFNDERCSEADMEDVINKNAYMLFYMRKDK